MYKRKFFFTNIFILFVFSFLISFIGCSSPYYYNLNYLAKMHITWFKSDNIKKIGYYVLLEKKDKKWKIIGISSDKIIRKKNNQEVLFIDRNFEYAGPVYDYIYQINKDGLFLCPSMLYKTLFFKDKHIYHFYSPCNSQLTEVDIMNTIGNSMVQFNPPIAVFITLTNLAEKFDKKDDVTPSVLEYKLNVEKIKKIIKKTDLINTIFKYQNFKENLKHKNYDMKLEKYLNYVKKNEKCHCVTAEEIANMGRVYFLQGKRKEGLKYMLKAQQICNDSFIINYKLGVSYYEYNRIDLAYKIFDKLNHDYPSKFNVLKNLALCAYKMKKFKKCKSLIKQALAIKHDIYMKDLYIKILFLDGKYEKALNYSVKNYLMKDAEDAASYLSEMQWRKFRKGEKIKALRAMQIYCSKYKMINTFCKEKELMMQALVHSDKIPLPKPLPDQVYKYNFYATLPFTTNEILNLKSIKQTLKPSENKYALIVGINNYKNFKGPNFAKNDAINIYNILIKRAGFINDSNHIKLLINDEATLGNFYSNIYWLTNKAKLNPKATIFFYFSGHGSPVISNNNNIKDGLLVPYDASLEALNSNDNNVGISLSFLQKEFGKLKNKNIICVIDACFSGTGKSVTAMKLITPEFKKPLVSLNKVFISAAATDRPAKEYEPGQQGAFTYFFLKGLLGDADTNKDNWVDTLEAFNYAKNKLQALGYDQNPQITSNLRIKLTKIK